MIPNYDRKWDYLTRKYPWCPIALEKRGERRRPTDMHHARAHDTKANRRLYPLFINSVFNLIPVDHDMHLSWPSWGRWSYRKCAWYEARLQANPELAAWSS